MKEEIIKISLAGFLKYGIRRMTIQKLVSPLGISSKTVYKYFNNKEELLRQCLTLHYNRLFDDALAVFDKEPNAVLALDNAWKQALENDFGINKVFYHDLNYYYPALQDEIIKKHGNKISGAFNRLINQGVRDGYLRKDLNPRVIFEAMTVLYSSLTRTEQFKKFGLSPADLAKHTVRVYLQGICTGKGLKQFNISG